MSNGFVQQSNDNKATLKWLQHVQRRDASLHAQTVADSLCPITASLSLSLRPPAEPPPQDTTLQSVMMGNHLYPDQDAFSVSSNNTFNSLDSNDSLFGIPPLHRGPFSSSDDDDSYLFRGSNRTHYFEFETVTSESLFDTTYEDDRSISTTESLFPSNFDNVGPPPPGSLMDLWDTPFSTSCLHNFPSPGEDAKCFTTTSNMDDTESLSDSSLELANDDDMYAEFNPIQPHPVLSLTRRL